MWQKASRSASVAALVVESLWAVSQGASAATVEITSDVTTANAQLTAVATPVAGSVTGNFQQSVTGGDTPINGIGSGGRLSPYAFNTDSLATTGVYSVLGDGGANGGSPDGSATYNVNAPGVEILWGSPDSHNQAAFFSGLGGMGTNLGTFTGAQIGAPPGSGSLSTLVTFFASSGDIGSVMLSNSTAAAFEFGGPDPVPLPPAIYLFGSVLGGAFWLGRRKRSTGSGAVSA